MIRRRDLVISPLLGALAMGLLVLVAYYRHAWGAAAPVAVDASTLPDVEAGVVRWWQNGALAAPVTVLAFGLLVVLERLSTTRWPGLGWLRWGSTRAYLSMAIGAVAGLLPAVASGSVTWEGFAVALFGGLVAFRPGGGEQRPVTERAGEIEAP